MLLNRAVSVGSVAVVGVALLLIPARWASAQRAVDAQARTVSPAPDPATLIARRPLPKTPTEELRLPIAATGEIGVKFNDVVRARVQGGILNAQGGVNVQPAVAIMNQFGLTAKPMFGWTPQRLANLENRAATVSGKAQPDLAGMILFEGPWENLQAAARALNQLPSVEWVSFQQQWRPMVPRRCCFPEDGHCEMFELQECIDLGGSPGSATEDCTLECGPGACCVDGDCTNVFDEDACQVLNGIWQGWGPGDPCEDQQIDCDAAQCGEGTDSCFLVHPNPACEDQECCDLVCGLLPTCCDTPGGTWDQFCVDLANLFCPSPACPGMPVGNCPDRCASPFNGDCFTPHTTGGCIDEACCNLVCALDPFCCALQGGFWDASCVSLADINCTGSTTSGPTPDFTPLQGYLRESEYRQQAGGAPPFTSPTGGGGWNLRGDNYGLWVINEINVVPDPDPTYGDANRDGASNNGDQYVEIVNNHDNDRALGGWTLVATDNFFMTPVVVHTFPGGPGATVIKAGEAIVVFGTAPPDPNDPAFGGSTVQGASSGALGLFPAINNPALTGTLQLRDLNDRLVTSYTWGEEASNQAPINRIPDVSGPDVFPSGGRALIPLKPCAFDTDCEGTATCFDDNTTALGACTEAVVTPGTRSDGTAFSFDRYLGLYGTSRELIETFGIGQTMPPGTGNFNDLVYNSRGKGINVAVIEWAFYQGHEDLNVIIEPGQTLIPIPENVPDHATACLGIINGQENTFGVTGVAPDAQAWFFPLVSVEDGPRGSAAFLSAYETLNPGDVVSCSFGPGGPYWNLNNEPASWTLMRMGSDLGITTCLSAGNDCENLSQVNNIGDSGAIVVGAGAPSEPWCRLTFSNYYQNGDFDEDSNVVHVQAWGAGVTTTGYGTLFNPDNDPDRSYIQGFSGTSASAPQVAGLVACLQGLAKQFYGIHLGPIDMRGALVADGSRFQCLIEDPDDLPGFPAIVDCGPDTDPDSGPNRIGKYTVPGRGGGTASWAVLNNSSFDQSPLLDGLAIVTGDLVQGNLFSVKGADDNYLIIDSVAANPNGIGSAGHDGGIVTGDTTMFQLSGHMQSSGVQSLQVDVEAFVNSGFGLQLVYLYDWQINGWIAIGLQFLGAIDIDEAAVFPVDNASRFIRSSDFEVRIRVQTVALGVAGQHRSFTDWVNISRNLGNAQLSAP